MDKSLTPVFVSALIISLVVALSVYWITSITVPLTWKACGSGHNAVCIQANKREDIKTLPDGCIGNNNTVICGSYWIREDRW